MYLKDIYLIIIQLAEKSVFFRMLARRVYNLVKMIAYCFIRVKYKVKDKTILFISYSGKSYSCSPKALYEYMISDQVFKDYTFVWAFTNPGSYSHLVKNNNTIIIKANSRICMQYYAQSKYIIVNTFLPTYISRRKQQVYLQCWHGTPLKRLGFDILFDGGDLMNSISEIRKKYSIESKRMSFMLSPSRFTSDKLITAFNLKALDKENAIIEQGYPRNDYLFKFTESNVNEIKQRIGIDKLDSRKVVLYAPTWRGNQYSAGLGYTYQNTIDLDKLKYELSDRFIFLYRTHYLVGNMMDFEKYNSFVYNVSDYDDINELFIISDLLITDYSSLFFDYAILNRPIIFYMYDFDMYRDQIRGFYLSMEELPGCIVKEERELIRILKYNNYDEKYRMQDFNIKYNYLEDGQASKRVVDLVINKVN